MKRSLLQRVDQWVRQLLPFSLTFFLILVNAMPTRLPNFAVIAPLMPLIGVYYWAIYRPDLLPPSVAFALGIVNDIIEGMPLGVSPLVYLLVQGMTASQRRFFHGKSFLVFWCCFALVGAGALGIQWALVSMLVGHVLGLRAVVVEFLMTLSFYPLVSWLFARAQLALLRRA